MEENIYNGEVIPPVQPGGLRIHQTAALFLRQAAKWARFIAIMGFVFCGLMVILALTASAWMSSLTGPMRGYGGMYGLGSALPFTIGYLIGAAIYFFMALYLYRFATKTRQALSTWNDNDLTEAFANLKNMFQLYGIILIIALLFIGLAMLIGIFAGIAAAF